MGGVVCVNEPVIELLRNSRRSVYGGADAVVVVVNRLPTTHAHRGLLAPLHAGGHCTVGPGNIAWGERSRPCEGNGAQSTGRLGELDVVSATEMSPTVEIYYPLSIYTYIGFALFSN